jgi:hypothetical protein
MSIVLKTKILSYTDTLENQFAIKVFKSLNEKYNGKYNVSVLVDKFSSVDYVVVNTENKKKMYMELKSRKSKSFSSFIIGYNKLVSINQNYPNTILIWNFADDIFSVKFHPKFVEYEISYCCESKVVNIEKSLCSAGMESIIDNIISSLE